ncbi:MAG: hypothetical protein ACI33S_05135 [Bacilli bacterium]
MMKKEKLKKLKAGLLALILCITLGSCKKNEDKQESNNETVIFFVEGKALIYQKEYDILINSDYSAISNSMIKYDNITTFSAGVDTIKVKSMEDAIELATAIVGEENIIYIDYEDEDMKLTYTK